jgi:hypothetical protein
MPKAKAHPGQLGFAFEAPAMAHGEACLAGLEQQICSAVGVMLNSDGRTRWEIAAKVSELLAEEVSKFMLDSYASPAREEHRVPMSRLLAIAAVTGRHDLLDPILRRIGAAVLVGEEVHTARVGHLRAQRKQIDEELRALERQAPLIRGDTGGKPRD